MLSHHAELTSMRLSCTLKFIDCDIARNIIILLFLFKMINFEVTMRIHFEFHQLVTRIPCKYIFP